MSKFTASQKEKGMLNFAQIRRPMSKVTLGRVKHRLKRLNRLNATHCDPEMELVSFADNFAKQEGFTASLVGEIQSLSSPDGMPFNRRQANFEALTEQMQFFLNEDVPNRWYSYEYRSVIEELIAWASTLEIEPYDCETEEQCDALVTNKNAIRGWMAVEDGLPDHKSECKGFYLEIRNNMVKDIHNGKDLKFPIIWIGKVDAMPEGDSFTRKLRGVNPVDMRVSLVSAPYAKAVDDVIHQAKVFGPGKSLEQLHQMIWLNRSSCTNIILGDYSKFDSTQPAWLLTDVFRIFKAMFKKGTVDEVVWDAMVDAFINKTYLTYDGENYYAFDVHHGNVSGHDFTTAVNCMVNLIIQIVSARHFGMKVDLNITGDDSVVFVKNDCENLRDPNFINDYCSFVTKFFGIILKAKATKLLDRQDVPTYLSIEWTPMGPARDVRELVSKLAWPRYPRPEGEWNRALQFYSYYMCYPVTMGTYFDMKAFFDCYNVDELKFENLSSADLDLLPYYFAERVRREIAETIGLKHKNRIEYWVFDGLYELLSC